MLGAAMKDTAHDTAPTVEQILIEGYRRMSAGEKLARVADLNETVMQLAAARIRQQYGSTITERELRLRLASLWLDRDTMRRVFHWDPEERGY